MGLGCFRVGFKILGFVKRGIGELSQLGGRFTRVNEVNSQGWDNRCNLSTMTPGFRVGAGCTVGPPKTRTFRRAFLGQNIYQGKKEWGLGKSGRCERAAPLPWGIRWPFVQSAEC